MPRSESPIKGTTAPTETADSRAGKKNYKVSLECTVVPGSSAHKMEKWDFVKGIQSDEWTCSV